MKTAEKWIDKGRGTGLEGWLAYIRAIQLDAIRHGMTLAADTVMDADNRRRILTARDNLKELP